MPNFKKSLFIFSFIFVLALFSLPLISLAVGLVPTGPQCHPNDPSQDMLCPFNPGKYHSTAVEIKWEVPNLPSDPENVKCYLQCSRPFTLPGSGPCTSPLPDDGPAVSPIGATIVRYPAIYNIYQVYCQDTHDPANPWSGWSHKTTIVEDIPCEIPASSIFWSLNSNMHTFITEESFAGWGSSEQESDNFDASGWLGSGDQKDIKKEMEANQLCAPMTPGFIDPDAGIRALKAMKVYTDARQPAKMGLLLIDNNWVIKGAHAVVALKITEEANNSFIIRVLDSGSPLQPTVSVYDMNCKPKTITYEGETITTMICQSSGGYSSIYILNEGWLSNWRQSFFNYCSQNSVSSFCQERQNMSSWVENNYPDILNFSGTAPETEEGVCSGWTDFVLKVAYLGEFVGKDYHPDDNLIVGIDCDYNHFPLTKSSSWLTRSRDWVTNSWSAIWQLF